MSVTYQFRLSDSEFATQFLTEHFRRGPMVWLRMALALGVGIMSFRIYGRADTQLTQIASLCGLFYSGFVLLKPFFSCLGALYMRSKMNSDEKNVQVEIDPRGIHVRQGKTRSSSFGWTRIKGAGVRSSYFYFELDGGVRAAIPKRAVEDPEEFVEIFRERAMWQG